MHNLSMSEYNAVSRFLTNYKFLKHLLISLILWLTLIAFSAMINHNITQIYGSESSFLNHFTRLIPWYIPNIFFSVVVVYAVTWIHEKYSSFISLLIHHVLMFTSYFIITIVGGAFLVFLISGKLAEKESFWEGFQVVLSVSRWQYDIVAYVAIVLVGYLVCYLKQIRARDIQNAQLQAQLYKVELEALRAQLNPHFLFNALNTISGLTRVGDAKKATKALSELSFMLRSVLESPNKQTTSLKEEIDFVQKYLHFQDLRFGERISYRIDIEPNCPDISVPFLLIHTLVENAVKHGSNMVEEQNEIQLKAYLDNDKVCIKLINTSADVRHDEGFGIGIMNCEKRLSHIYGSDFSLSAAQQANLYITQLLLPLRPVHA